MPPTTTMELKKLKAWSGLQRELDDRRDQRRRGDELPPGPADDGEEVRSDEGTFGPGAGYLAA